MRRLICLWCALLVAAPAQGQDHEPWAEIAMRDLEAVRRLIFENHPGPVDRNNPGFTQWLNRGFEEARARASGATGFSDYKRVLRYYLNGFSDGHLSVSFPIDASRQLWPGFLPVEADDGTLRIGLSRIAGASTGARLLTCDGVEARELLEQRVLPYWWNRQIPHSRPRTVPRLLVLDPTDQRQRLRSCVIDQGGERRTLSLRWMSIRAEEANRLREEASAGVAPQLGLRRIDGIWFAAIPSFFFSTDTEVAAFRAFLGDLARHADELRRGPLILDLRGGGGGNSAWGREAAVAIWGDAWVQRIQSGFDNTVDWRVSASNVTRNREVADELARDGLADMAAGYRRLALDMAAALARGQPLLRVEDGPGRISAVAPPNPVTGRVFVLTDTRCFSACLDFVDIVRRMPNVRHIGLPTAADTIYMENTSADLPSGLAQLFYSTKVYRNRVRGHNEWYEPHVRWSGGPMTDEAMVRWVRALVNE